MNIRCVWQYVSRKEEEERGTRGSRTVDKYDDTLDKEIGIQ